MQLFLLGRKNPWSEQVLARFLGARIAAAGLSDCQPSALEQRRVYGQMLGRLRPDDLHW